MRVASKDSFDIFSTNSKLKMIASILAVLPSLLVMVTCNEYCERGTDSCSTSTTTDKIPETNCFHTQGKGDVFCIDEDMTAHGQTYYKDYDNKRIIEVMSDSSPGPALFVYRNFTTWKKYVMLRDGTCMEFPMIGENTHCIPSEASFKDSIQLEEGYESGKFRRLESWEFQSNGEFDGRVIDKTEGRRRPFVFRKKDNMVTYWFHNVVDKLEEDDFLFFDVDLSACK